LALGNIFEDISVPHGGLKGARIAAQGQKFDPANPNRKGILGNLNFSGNIDGGSAIVSGGMIGDPISGTGISAGNVIGILAADGSITILSANVKGTVIQKAAGSTNGMVIDSIFAPGAFDVGGNLQGLATILGHLNNLHVGSDGNLTIMPFLGKSAGLSMEITGVVTSGTADLQTVGWSANVGDSITLGVYVANPDGTLTADEHARIDDAIATLDQTLTGTVGLDLVEVTDPTLATIIISNSSTSAAGGQANGVLGCTTLTFGAAASGALDEGVPYLQFTGQGVVDILEGWNWFAGSDSTQIGAGQFDYQSVVTHELGHAVGLYHDVTNYGTLNGDGYSTMYPVLNPAQIHRQLSTYDVSWLNHLYANGDNPGGNDGPESVAALRAGPLTGSVSVQLGVNERSQMPLLSETTFQSPRDLASFQPASFTETAGLGNAPASPAAATLLPLDPSAGMLVMNSRMHDPMPAAPVSAPTQPNSLLATDSLSRVEFYTGLTGSQDAGYLTPNSSTDLAEVKPVLVPNHTGVDDVSLPTTDKVNSEAFSKEVPTIWNCDSHQFSAEDQWAGSIRDTLYSSCDTIEDSAAVPLAAIAWLAATLPGREKVEIGKKRPALRI
jgi:hypothetical protein